MPKSPKLPKVTAPAPEKPSKAEIRRQVDAIHAQLHVPEAPKGTHQAPATLDAFLNLVRPALMSMSKAKLARVISLILGVDEP